MLRIDQINLRRQLESRIMFSSLQQIVENKLKEAASATKFRTTQNDAELEIILKDPVSLQTANKILNVFSKEGIKIKELTWKSEKIGPFERGHLEITIS